MSATGPTINDFMAAFGLKKEGHMSSAETDNLAREAFQRLNEWVQQNDIEIKKLRDEMKQLSQHNNNLQQRLVKLEYLVTNYGACRTAGPDA
jgi:hypothetical protein